MHWFRRLIVGHEIVPQLEDSSGTHLLICLSIGIILCEHLLTAIQCAVNKEKKIKRWIYMKIIKLVHVRNTVLIFVVLALLRPGRP